MGRAKGKKVPLGRNNLPPPPYPDLPLSFRAGPVVNRQLMTYPHKGSLVESAAGAGAYYQFRLNDIYDPDYTGTGSSAMGYSTWANFYSRFKVLRTRVHVEIINNNTYAALAGCFPQASSVFTASPTYWPVQPFARAKTIEGYQNGGPNSKAVFDFVVDHSVVFGVTEQQYLIDQDYGANFGASPSKSSFLSVFIQGYGSTSAVAYLRVVLSMDVELSQPIHSITT